MVENLCKYVSRYNRLMTQRYFPVVDNIFFSDLAETDNTIYIHNSSNTEEK